MIVHKALSELGFSLVSKTATSGHYRHHRVPASAVLATSIKPQVIISGVQFAGVKTVGDIRQLMRLKGMNVPGVPNPCPADDHERDRDQKEQAKWMGSDALALRCANEQTDV